MIKQKDWINIAKEFQKRRSSSLPYKEKKLYSNLKSFIRREDYIFYRIEKDGLGPFTTFHSNKDEDWIDGKQWRRSLCSHESCVDDVWCHTSQELYIHACYSLKNLKSWFSECEWKTLLSMGYEVKEYKLDRDFKHLFLADNQVLLFNTPRAPIMRQLLDYWEEKSRRDSELLALIL